MAAVVLLCLAMYHAWIRRIPVLAGVIVPALIMMLYAAWVLILTKKDKQRGKEVRSLGFFPWSIDSKIVSFQPQELENPINDQMLSEVTSTSSSSSSSRGLSKTHAKSLRQDLLLNQTHRVPKHQSRRHSELAQRNRDLFLRTKNELLAQRDIPLPQFPPQPLARSMSK